MEPVISVIVPVYNVDAYLDRCVESIVNQTYKNLEIILVDDGSTDSSGLKCDEWKNKDNRILVIHKENGGLSDARNVGLCVSKGEYIGFVDSDDCINPIMYQVLFNSLVENYADISECGLLKFTDENEINIDIDFIGTVKKYSTEQALKELILERDLIQTVCNKLYRREAICSDFPVGKINEDDFWTYKIFGKAKRVVCIDAKLYYYFQRSSSIMHVKYSVKRLDGIRARKERLKYISKNFSNLYLYACASYLSSCFYHYQVISRTTDIDPEKKYRKYLINEYRENYDTEAIKTKSLKQRIWYFGFKIMPNTTCFIRNRLKIGL